MTDVTVSRDGTSVTFNAVSEGTGIPLSYAVSKPQQNISVISDIDPRARDNFQNVETFTVTGVLLGSGAYTDARVLAQDLIKPYSNGSALSLDLSNFDGFGSYNVAPITSNALTLEYPPGQKDWVAVNLNLTRHTAFTDSGNTQTVSGPAPVVRDSNPTVTNPDTGESVTFELNESVTRTVGRPNSNLEPRVEDVKYIDRIQSAEDAFEIRGELKSATAATDAVTAIQDIFGDPLGNSALTLDFDGKYGLGEYSVVPAGDQAGRITITSGEKDVRTVGPLNLVVVTN